jgi:hypothetical protein
MAWTAPLSWMPTMVTHTILNTHIKDNFLELSTHVHSGSAGEGSSTLSVLVLSAQNYFPFADQSGNPSSIGVLQRNGAELVYYDTALKQLTADAVAGTASSRTLGTGAQQAAAGNHTH